MYNKTDKSRSDERIIQLIVQWDLKAWRKYPACKRQKYSTRRLTKSRAAWTQWKIFSCHCASRCNIYQGLDSHPAKSKLVREGKEDKIQHVICFWKLKVHWINKEINRARSADGFEGRLGGHREQIESERVLKYHTKACFDAHARRTASKKYHLHWIYISANTTCSVWVGGGW